MVGKCNMSLKPQTFKACRRAEGRNSFTPLQNQLINQSTNQATDQSINHVMHLVKRDWLILMVLARVWKVFSSVFFFCFFSNRSTRLVNRFTWLTCEVTQLFQQSFFLCPEDANACLFTLQLYCHSVLLLLHQLKPSKGDTETCLRKVHIHVPEKHIKVHQRSTQPCLWNVHKDVPKST